MDHPEILPTEIPKCRAILNRIEIQVVKCLAIAPLDTWKMLIAR